MRGNSLTTSRARNKPAQKSNKLCRLFIFSLIVTTTVLTPFEYYTSGIGFYLFKICQLLPALAFFLILFLYPKTIFRIHELLFLLAFYLCMFFACVNLSIDYIGSLTYTFIGFYLALAIMCNHFVDDELLFEAFRVTSIIGVVVFLYFLIFEGFDISALMKNVWSIYTWEKPFYYARVLWATPYFVILSHIKKKQILLSSIVWLTYVAFNMMFLKRFVIVDSGIMLFFLMVLYIKRNNKSTIKILAIVILVICLCAVLLALIAMEKIPLLNKTIDRMTDSLTNVSKFDRLEEFTGYLSESNPAKIVLGGGFYNHFVSPEKDIRFNLHIGWADLIFKGGIILFLITLFSYFAVIRKLSVFCRLNSFAQFCVIAGLVDFFRMFYSGFAAYYPSMFVFFVIVIGLTKKIPRTEVE